MCGWGLFVTSRQLFEVGQPVATVRERTSRASQGITLVAVVVPPIGLLAAALGLPLAGVPCARAADADIANGIFLIASPELQDSNFRETVVLITQPEAGGWQLGVIVNRPLAAVFYGRGRWIGRLEEAATPPADATHRQRIEALIGDHVRWIERTVAAAPEQWWSLLFPIWTEGS